MPIEAPTLDLDDEAIALIHELRGAMPLDEFLTFCVEFGIAELRESELHQERGYLIGRMESSMAEHRRRRAKPSASNIKELPPRKKDE